MDHIPGQLFDRSAHVGSDEFFLICRQTRVVFFQLHHAAVVLIGHIGEISRTRSDQLLGHRLHIVRDLLVGRLSVRDDRLLRHVTQGIIPVIIIVAVTPVVGVARVQLVGVLAAVLQIVVDILVRALPRRKCHDNAERPRAALPGADQFIPGRLRRSRS